MIFRFQQQKSGAGKTHQKKHQNFIINSADYLGVDIIELRKDYKDRMYFVWSKNK